MFGLPGARNFGFSGIFEIFRDPGCLKSSGLVDSSAHANSQLGSLLGGRVMSQNVVSFCFGRLENLEIGGLVVLKLGEAQKPIPFDRSWSKISCGIVPGSNSFFLPKL